MRHVGVTTGELEKWLRPRDGWPAWAVAAPYVGAAHPLAIDPPPLDEGANCQRFAYAVLALFGRTTPPHRSSELWTDPALRHVAPDEAAALDLALFNSADEAWGAHVAVILGDDDLLHLCKEVGVPAVWRWGDFMSRDRYAHVVGIVRVPCAADGEA